MVPFIVFTAKPDDTYFLVKKIGNFIFNWV